VSGSGEVNVRGGMGRAPTYYNRAWCGGSGSGGRIVVESLGSVYTESTAGAQFLFACLRLCVFSP
jgi:hypothetical protein